MQIVDIEIKKLVLLKDNPRKITKDELDKLCDSLIKDPGFMKNRPVLVNEVDGILNVYAGNQRVQSAKKLKWKTISCIIEKDLSEELITQRILRDNKHSGTWDYDILANDYDIETLVECGFTPEELHLNLEVEDLGSSGEEDQNLLEPCKDEDAITKLGDVYELNSHRVICGDSTMPDIVEKVLNGNVPILMVTDPPYGVNYDPNWRGKAGKGQKAAGKVQNDDKINWALAWHLFPGSVAYVWCASWFSPDVAKDLKDCEYELKSLIIWVKQNFALSRGDYHWQHEPCWYAIKKGHQHNWQGSRKESTVWEIASLNAFGKSKEEDERTAHSTQKPLECMERPIRNNTTKGEGVYDPFLGSGTTLIASEKTDRVCYGVELSPAYCDIIVNRWKNFMIKNNKSFSIKKNGELIG